MRFACHFDYSPHPIEPELYINPLTVDVFCSDEDLADCLVARLRIDHLNLTRAEASGANIYQICDADSSGWEAVYTAILEKRSATVDVREDLEFHECVFDILFLHHSFFHPAVYDWRMYIIDHVARLLGESSVFVMWQGETGLPESELARLGFCRIAQNKLLFRGNMLRHDYDAEMEPRDVNGIEVDSTVHVETETAWED
jgi:hypothetical protein